MARLICGEKGSTLFCDSGETITNETKKENKQTNADRIRSMSDEELAVMLKCPAEYDLNFNKNCNCSGEMNRNCRKCALKWLQSEVEDK